MMSKTKITVQRDEALQPGTPAAGGKYGGNNAETGSVPTAGVLPPVPVSRTAAAEPAAGSGGREGTAGVLSRSGGPAVAVSASTGT